MTFWKWSKTAASNGSADSTCPFPEGMSPAALNDGARGMMAAAAKYRDDIAGAIVTSGTSTAYTVSSNQSFDTLAHLDGAMIAFTPHTTSGGTTTLNVDGLGAKALRSGPSVELPSGTLVQGTPYVVTYSNADSAFYLHGFLWNPYNMPVGSCIDYFGSTAPNSSFVLAYGQAISRTTYATLFSMFSTTYGVGDGSTTFNVPDLRGRVIAGKDDMGGSAISRLTSSFFGGTATNLGAVGGSEFHNLTTAQLASHSHANTLNDPGHTHSYTQSAPFGSSGAGAGINGTTTGGTTGSATTGITITNASAGSGGAHNNVQPTIIANKLLRII